MVNDVKYAINVPNFGDYFHPSILANLASDAEKAGWDGFFIWDHISGPTEWRVPVGDSTVPIAHAPYADPCVALTAIAIRTKRIRIGALVTPLARRRPWKLARETVSIDHLSNGRLVVGVGLGGTLDEFEVFGEDGDSKVRSRKLDEGLDILTGLWTGKPFSYSGEHYTIDETVFIPKPIQSPRIPIWVACFWPNKKPLRRATRYDGVVPSETNTRDNTISNGWIIVATLGDVTGPEGYPDGVCDIRDIGNIACLLGLDYPHPLYNPNFDIYPVLCDGKIDLRDLSMAAKNFGKTNP